MAVNDVWEASFTYNDPTLEVCQGESKQFVLFFLTYLGYNCIRTIYFVICMAADKHLQLYFIFCISTLCLRKKQDTKLLPITSRNVNRFSKFFHW